MMMNGIGTGLIGAGFMGKYHALAFGTVKGGIEPEEMQDLMARGGLLLAAPWR